MVKAEDKNEVYISLTQEEIHFLSRKALEADLSFNELIEKHETIISSKIKKETVKNTLFKDFNGSIKSLGAWGGDFVLACGHNNLKNYFKNKGFGSSYSFNEMLK